MCVMMQTQGVCLYLLDIHRCQMQTVERWEQFENQATLLGMMLIVPSALRLSEGPPTHTLGLSTTAVTVAWPRIHTASLQLRRSYLDDLDSCRIRVGYYIWRLASLGSSRLVGFALGCYLALCICGLCSSLRRGHLLRAFIHLIFFGLAGFPQDACWEFDLEADCRCTSSVLDAFGRGRALLAMCCPCGARVHSNSGC